MQRGIRLAETAQQLIEAEPSLRIVTPARLGVVTFELADDPDAAGRVAAKVTADGYAALTSTILADRPVLRLCTINPRTTRDDLAGTIRRVTEAAGRP